jgi:dihydrofolate reductase
MEVTLMSSKIILYIAMSLDGYIAKEDGSIDWLSMVDTPGEDYGYAEFVKSVGTIIMGRKTYEKILSLGAGYLHRDKTNYVLSNEKTGSDENVTFYSGSLEELILKTKQKENGHIFIDGGASVVHALLSHHLIEECVISIIPVILGGGIRLFQDGLPETKLTLISSEAFPSGLVQLWYQCI